MAQLDIKQIKGASQGSILFLGTNSVVSENSNNFSWNNSSNSLYVSGGFQYVDGNQQSGYILISDANGNANWTSSISGGATNGLSILNNGLIGLGGTLSQNTSINADGLDFILGNFNQMSLTGSILDIELQNGIFIVDSSSVDLYADDVLIFGTNSIDLLTKDFEITASKGLISTSNLQGLVYTSDYYSTFVTHSLIDRNYVDTKISTLGNISGVTAGAGLTGGGTSSYITLDVNVNSDSLQILDDYIRLKDTITGDRIFQDSVTIGGNLVVNGTTSYIYTENLLVEDNFITLNATYSGPYNYLDTGIESNLGGGTYASLVWSSNSSLWTAGLSGSLSPILLYAGYGLTQNGATVSIDTSVAVIGATNGLSILSGLVGFGGTLSQSTQLFGDSYDLSIGGIGYLLFTSSIFDVEADFISLDAGTGSMQFVADEDIDIVSLSGELSIIASASTVTTTNNLGLVYATDYHDTFVAHSLVDKNYVDLGTSSIWTYLSNLNNGLTPSNGLSETSSGFIGLGGTLLQNTSINGDSFNFTFGNLNNLTFTASNYAKIELYDGNDIVSVGVDGVSSYLRADVGLSMSLLNVYKGSNAVSDGSINNTLVVIDQISQKGLVYNDDYSANFTTYSLVTKGYVDNLLGSPLALYDSNQTTVSPSTTASIYNFATASYTSAHVDYNIQSGLNLRAGSLTAVWYDNSIQFTENSTNDIGDTSGFTFSFVLSGTYAVLQAYAELDTWTVKTIIRSI